MIYSFEARDGSTVEREYPMAQAPKLGTRIRVKGKTYRRVLERSSGGCVIEKDTMHPAYAFTKAQAQRYCKRFDKHGHGLLLDSREIANVESRMKDDGVPLKYDRGLHGERRGKKL
jgi:hypothetical protein